MTASWIKLAFAVGAAGAFTALIPSCADNHMTIFIRQMQALEAPECTVNNDVSALHTPSGFIDVGIASNYMVHPLVGNQLLSKGDPRQAKAEPNRVQLEGAEIELVNARGDALAIGESNPYSVIATGTIDPTSSADAAYGVTQVEVIPPKIMAVLRKTLHDSGGIGTTQTIHAKISVFGHTLGGTAVETGTFTFPITACYGCGVSVPAEAVDPKLGTRNCKGVSATTSAGGSQKTICSAGQDALTDCRLCQGVLPLCTPCTTTADCGAMLSPLTKTPAVCNTTAGFCE